MNTPLFRADLHCHSTYSDGSLTPEELLLLAKELGLQGLSITDHDTIGAYEKAIPIAQECGIALLTGAEFSAACEGTSIHVLAYAFPPKSNILTGFCHQHALRREKRAAHILSLLRKHGLRIEESDLFAMTAHAPGRLHIAKAMVQKGYVRTIEEAFRLYIGDRAPCFDPGEQISVQETIEIIHRAGGFAVLAHPHLIKKQRVLRKVLDMEFDGIEAYYGTLPNHQERRWLAIAEHRDWLVTGGSDFHGNHKACTQLGASWVGQQAFSLLFEHGKRHELLS